MLQSEDRTSSGEFSWEVMEAYACAYLEHRIPEHYLEGSQIVYQRAGLMRTDRILLPKGMQIRAALAEARPRDPWWVRLRQKLHA